MTRSPILVIGRTGQVAQALAAEGGARVISAGRPDVDLLDEALIDSALADVNPAVVINAGAYTFVDGAESEPELAAEVNARGPERLARLCARRGIPLIHLSTDCVFDGTKSAPYTPDDEPGPLSVYGRTKLAGARAVAGAHPRHLVVRVSWVFSRFGSNFVRTMLRAAETRDEVAVVNDQVGCPTHAPALARALLAMADRALDEGFSAWGLYHLAGAGEVDRATMTRMIFEESARLGGPSARVRGVASADYPTPAARPLNARLDMSLTTEVFGVTLPDWKIGLSETVGAILKEQV